MRIIICYIVCSFLFISCTKLNIYTNGNEDAGKDELIQFSSTYIPTIQVDDKLSLSIWGHEDMSVGSVFGIYNSNEVFGKWLLVAPDSSVVFPRIGRLKIAGLTTEQARDSLVAHFANHILNPVIDLRIHNHEVSVIGQVIKPGNYPIYKGKNTLSYLIAAAGGTDYYANLQSVKLVRGEKSYLLDLTKLTPYEMDRLTLIQGDILYFPTKNGKALDKKSPALLAIASITTTILLLIAASQK